MNGNAWIKNFLPIHVVTFVLKGIIVVATVQVHVEITIQFPVQSSTIVSYSTQNLLQQIEIHIRHNIRVA